MTCSWAKRSERTLSAMGAQLAGSVSTLRCTPSSCAQDRVRVQRGFGSGEEVDFETLVPARDAGRVDVLRPLPEPIGPVGIHGRGSEPAKDTPGEKREVVGAGEPARLAVSRHVEKMLGSIVMCSACEAVAGWAEKGVRRRLKVERLPRTPKWRFQAGC